MKLAVIFPGIGYHTDKPLLYYSKKLAKKLGYEIVEVPYRNFPENVKGSKERMEDAFRTACEQSEALLKDVDFEGAEEILFISKSIGTVVAAYYAKRHRIRAKQIYFTPVEATFAYVTQPGIVFHGTSDSWVETSAVRAACEARKLPLFITECADHSLETGDVCADLEHMKTIMEQCEKYLNGLQPEQA